MANLERIIITGLQPGSIIPFNEVSRRLGMDRNVCRAWKYDARKNPNGIRVFREQGSKEFVFTDDVIAFLRQRWTQESRDDR